MRSRSIYKSPAEMRAMLEPGRITAAALSAVRDAIRPGVTTLELDAIAERVIRDAGAEPNFALEPGYRHTICASVNDDVVHGIPTDRPLEAGDILSIDCGALFEGWNGDAAFTVVLPDDGQESRVRSRSRLSAVTEGSLWAGIAALASAKHLGAVGEAIEAAVDARGQYGIVEGYAGHGIGRAMHEEPSVFNYAVRGRGAAIKPGLVVAIEPMVTAGSSDTVVRDDEWTVATSDGSDAAHWEHSVAVHAHGVWVLTAPDGGRAGLAPFGIVPTPLA
ncbi:type I methionyl aminopeptidase [Marisediminicola sp. LYQ134]|uniref:type I methionyl aminopeptidase n=1 Tax=Marisediminicola sp. LYQ134 TaxID=3391061 RepID=UPI0039832524